MTKEKTLAEILRERHTKYGDFNVQAELSQKLKDVLQLDKRFLLRPFQREALQMIASKISRILNGDCNHIDSWRDIAGYAELVADILKENDEKI